MEGLLHVRSPQTFLLLNSPMSAAFKALAESAGDIVHREAIYLIHGFSVTVPIAIVPHSFSRLLLPALAIWLTSLDLVHVVWSMPYFKY